MNDTEFNVEMREVGKRIKQESRQNVILVVAAIAFLAFWSSLL